MDEAVDLIDGWETEVYKKSFESLSIEGVSTFFYALNRIMKNYTLEEALELLNQIRHRDYTALMKEFKEYGNFSAGAPFNKEVFIKLYQPLLDLFDANHITDERYA